MTESEDHGGAQEAQKADPGNAATCYKRALLSVVGRPEKAVCESASLLWLREHLDRGGVHGLQVKPEHG